MDNDISTAQTAMEDYPIDSQRQLTYAEIREIENAAYAQELKQKIGPLKKYCRVEEMAKAICDGFEVEYVYQVCNDNEPQIKVVRTCGVDFVPVDAFIEKLMRDVFI